MATLRARDPKLAAPKRCGWARSPVEITYHDREWGVPLHDDRKLFEFLVLEGAQAGLSWETILKKRPAYRRAFDRFNARKIAGYRASDIRRLMADEGIVRNRLKIEAAITNARAYLRVREQFGSFDRYLWRFVGDRPLQNRRRNLRAVPAHTVESRAMSKSLLADGFRFVGPTICYAFMQAVGMVNDHLVDCFRHRELR